MRRRGYIVEEGRWIKRSQAKKLAQLYAGSILIQCEAPDAEGPIADAVREEIQAIGRRLAKSSGIRPQLSWGACLLEWSRDILCGIREKCCTKETRNATGGCDNCGDPSL